MFLHLVFMPCITPLAHHAVGFCRYSIRSAFTPASGCACRSAIQRGSAFNCHCSALSYVLAFVRVVTETGWRWMLAKVRRCSGQYKGILCRAYMLLNLSKWPKYPNFGFCICVFYRKSGGVASAFNSAITASSSCTDVRLSPRRRTDTVPSSTSRIPTAKITGTLPNECSRTL